MTAARAAGWLSPAVGLGGLLAALVAPVPPALGVAVAVGVSAVGYAALLLGVVPHRGVKLVQGAPFLGVGVLIAGGCGAAGATAGYAYPHAVVVDVPLAAEVPLVGLFFTVGMYLLGLLVVPSIAATFVGRLRRFLDAIGLGVCAFFVAWLLLFADGGMRGGALTAVLLASIALASTVVAGLRAVRFGRAAIPCTAGPAGSIAGLTWLTVALDYHAGGYATVPAGLALVGSAALTWYGARTVRANRPPRAAADSDGSFARYPLFALPLVAALVTAGYHLVQHHGLDPVAMTLSLVGVGVVALRETLAALDVRRYAGRLATREAHFRSLVAGSTDVTVVLGPDLVVRWQSPAAARQFGLSDQDVVGRPLLAPLLALVHPDDADRAAGCLAALAAGGTVATLIEAPARRVRRLAGDRVEPVRPAGRPRGRRTRGAPARCGGAQGAGADPAPDRVRRPVDRPRQRP